MKLTEAQKLERLRRALIHAAMSLEEASCTCVDRSDGHQRGCVGVDQAKDYFRLADRARAWK